MLSKAIVRNWRHPIQMEGNMWWAAQVCWSSHYKRHVALMLDIELQNLMFTLLSFGPGLVGSFLTFLLLLHFGMEMFTL
jgi:hypothetical protein